MQKKISIFVDESGDFGKYDKKCPYYIISMVFHDQRFNITSEVEHLDKKLKYKNLEGHTLHAGPLIRREYPYTNMDNSIIPRSEATWESHKQENMASEICAPYSFSP